MYNKLKICVDARMVGHSGIGTYIRMLLPFFCEKFEVTLLGDPAILITYGLKANIISFKAPIYSIEEQRRFKAIIPPVDIFWSPHYNAPLLSIKARKRVVTIHDVFHLAFYNELSFKQKLYARFVINKAITNSDDVVTVSHFSKDEITKFTRCNAAKITVIHNGVNQCKVDTVDNNVVNKYHLPQQYVLFVGNVKPHKNLNTLLKAYLKLPADIRKEYKVVIVGKLDGFITGDDLLLKWIENTPELKANVKFAGFVNDTDMDALYSNASLFVLPSLYEGFGLPPLEAMLNRCPVMVSNIPSLAEVCGDAAIYFDPYDDDDIAAKITSTLTNKPLMDTIIKNGTERIKMFSWVNSANEHIDLFNQIIK